jgi:hypothetical protein
MKLALFLRSLLRVAVAGMVLAAVPADAQPFQGKRFPGGGGPRMGAPMDARPFMRERPPAPMPGPAPGMARRGGNCFAIGQQIAAQNGGQLANATAAMRGGQPVCIIVVLVPGRGGERPRRSEFVVPAG